MTGLLAGFNGDNANIEIPPNDSLQMQEQAVEPAPAFANLV